MVLPLLEKVLSQRAPPNTEDQHSVSSLISDLLLLLSGTPSLSICSSWVKY